MDGWVVVVNIEWLEAKFWTDLDGRSTPNNYPTTNQSIQYSIYLSTHQSVQIRPINPYISIHQSIHLHPSIHPPMDIDTSIQRAMQPWIHQAVHPSNYSHIWTSPLSLHLPIHSSINPSIRSFINPTVHPYIHPCSAASQKGVPFGLTLEISQNHGKTIGFAAFGPRQKGSTLWLGALYREDHTYAPQQNRIIIIQ